MSLRRSVELAKSRPPLSERLARKYFRKEKPLNPQLSELQVANRIAPLLGHIAAGEIPLDNPTIAAGAGRAVQRAFKKGEL